MPVDKLTAAQLDRAMGTLIGLAAGDALGAGLEFRPRVPYTTPVAMTGGGSLGWAPGQWTDDTAMAYAIADVAATGADLRSPEAQDSIARQWWTWAETAPDVGIQTRSILSAARAQGTAQALRGAADQHHRSHGRSAGNGSLMRTAPVALAYLGDADEEALWQAAQEISALTHVEDDAREACALWCLAIRHAILHGDFAGLRLALQHLPDERRELWSHRLDQAEALQSWQFSNNGWVVAALQAAWSAIVHTAVPAELPDLGLIAAQHAEHAIERAVRCGGDTDTVGAIAGSLIGARWGGSAIPPQWKLLLHGWRDANAADLARLAVLTVRGGRSPSGMWAAATTEGKGDAGQRPSLARISGVSALLEQAGQLLALHRGSAWMALYLRHPAALLQRQGGGWLLADQLPAEAVQVGIAAVGEFDEAEMAGRLRGHHQHLQHA
jgi:ADP-ribosylglycohydrolase